MSMKPETRFRIRVTCFVKSLLRTVAFPIQQIAIVGTPDFLMLVNGTFVGLELKSEEGTLSALQSFNLRQIERCGGVAIVADPKNWEEVKTRLKQLAGEIV